MGLGRQTELPEMDRRRGKAKEKKMGLGRQTELRPPLGFPRCSPVARSYIDAEVQHVLD
jgi:hypothetical protein